MSKGIFIVGTGTDVGKTYVTGLIIKKLLETGKKVGYYKAAVSGNDYGEDGKLIPGDALTVKKISGSMQELGEMCTYVYERAVSPHLAARIEGNPVEMDKVIDDYERVRRKHDFTVVEGSGGIMCPIRYDEEKIWLEDIIKKLGLSCLLIADAGLGTINSVVLTCHYLKDKGIDVKGIIFNHFHKGDVMEEDNVKMCEEKTGLKVIGFVADDSLDVDIDLNVLMEVFE